MTLLIAAAITFLACFLLVPSIFWLLRFFGFYAIVDFSFLDKVGFGIVVPWAEMDRLWPCVRCHDPGSLDWITWTGPTISGRKQPSIGNSPSRLTILSSKTRCLSWRPCVKRSPIISRTISQAGDWSRNVAR